MKALGVYVLLVLSSLLILGELTFGQAVFGNIVGTVSDSTGAAVQKAAVEITDMDRGTTYKATANESGNYEQTHLLAGRYKVRVMASGFSPFETTAVVQIDSSTRVDAQLGVQGQSTNVTVTAETPLLKADRADVSTTITTEEL